MTMQKTTSKPRGFAAMHPSKVSEIARKGGKSAHAAGTAHKWNAEEAKAAGVKGGKATHAKRAAKTTIATNAAEHTKTDKKDPHRMVEVVCSSAAGCAGQQHADEPGAEIVGELPTKGKGNKKNAEVDALGAALSGKDDLAEGDGGKAGGCGSGCSGS